MDNLRGFTASKHVVGILSLLVSLACFLGTPAQAQQPAKLNAAYAKAARLALSVIELDTSAPQDDDSEAIEIEITQTIDGTAKKAVTKEEESTTELLRQIYQLKRHDNSALRAYRILMEIENAEDASDDADTRNQKDYAVSQFADSQAAIMKHEEPCFSQLEQSLDHRMVGDTKACAEWIQKSMRAPNPQ